MIIIQLWAEIIFLLRWTFRECSLRMQSGPDMMVFWVKPLKPIRINQPKEVIFFCDFKCSNFTINKLLLTTSCSIEQIFVDIPYIGILEGEEDGFANTEKLRKYTYEQGYVVSILKSNHMNSNSSATMTESSRSAWISWIVVISLIVLMILPYFICISYFKN